MNLARRSNIVFGCVGYHWRCFVFPVGNRDNKTGGTMTNATMADVMVSAAVFALVVILFLLFERLRSYYQWYLAARRRTQ
jgi:hypothetical protein